MAKFTVAILTLALVFTFPRPYPVRAASTWEPRCIAGPDNDVATIQGFECIFARILLVITSIAALAFIAMFLVGGFQYLGSSGDPKKAAAAAATLTMSVVGLVGIIISWLVLRFISDFTSYNITDFVIPG